MDILVGVYVFALGAAFGSFALVLAGRMHDGIDWVKGRSVCDHCGHVLGPIDLVPLLSWILLNGKCRYCNHRLSILYPAVELGLGTTFLASFVYAPYELTGLFIPMFMLWASGLVVMTALVVADLKWYLLPSKLVYPLIITAIVHRIVEFFAYEQSAQDAIISGAAALVIGSGLFWVLNKISDGKWIGDGDYRLGIALALFLGDPILTWMALFFASVFGLSASLPTLVKSKNKARIKIPFGPFLIAGLVVSYLFGFSLLDWYTETFLYL